MSTSASFDDPIVFDESVASVRNDTSTDSYVIAAHVNNDPVHLHVLQVGQDVDDIVNYLLDDQVMYVLARYQSTFDMSNTVKFVFFRWHGENVPFTKKGKFGVVFGSIKEKFSYHLFIETGSREDFNKEKIAQQLEENSGMKSKVVERSEGQQMRGFTATQLPNRGPLTKSGPQISSVGAAIKVQEEVFKGISQVRNDEDPIKWVVAAYKDGNSKGPIILTASGEGDIEELKAVLNEVTPMYCLYRTTDVVDDITTVKFVYITWVGSGVKPMTKAKMSTHKGTAEDTFGPFHVSIYATDLTEITEDIIKEKVTSASGTKSNVK